MKRVVHNSTLPTTNTSSFYLKIYYHLTLLLLHSRSADEKKIVKFTKKGVSVVLTKVKSVV